MAEEQEINVDAAKEEDAATETEEKPDAENQSETEEPESLSPKEIKKKEKQEEKERLKEEKARNKEDKKQAILEKKQAKEGLKDEKRRLKEQAKEDAAEEKRKLKELADEDKLAKKGQSDKNDEDGKTTKHTGISPFLKYYFIFLMFSFSIVGAFITVKMVVLPKAYDLKVIKKMDKIREERSSKNKVGIMKNLESITVNTFGSLGRKFVIAEIAVEAQSQKIIDEVTAREPRYRDALIKYLRSHSAREIASEDFPDDAKREIKRIINSNLSIGWIDSVYFMKLIVN